MPRYVIERTFPTGLKLPATADGAAIARRIIGHNAEKGVTWIHSYVNQDKTKTFCVYDAPSPDAIRRVAQKNELPVDTITEVTVLDPYFYHH